MRRRLHRWQDVHQTIAPTIVECPSRRKSTFVRMAIEQFDWYTCKIVSTVEAGVIHRCLGLWLWMMLDCEMCRCSICIYYLHAACFVSSFPPNRGFDCYFEFVPAKSSFDFYWVHLIMYRVRVRTELEKIPGTNFFRLKKFCRWRICSESNSVRIRTQIIEVGADPYPNLEVGADPHPIR